MNEGKTVVAGRREVKKSGIRRKAPKPIGGRKAGEDHAMAQCPEEHPGTQGCLW